MSWRGKHRTPSTPSHFRHPNMLRRYANDLADLLHFDERSSIDKLFFSNDYTHELWTLGSLSPSSSRRICILHSLPYARDSTSWHIINYLTCPVISSHEHPRTTWMPRPSHWIKCLSSTTSRLTISHRSRKCPLLSTIWHRVSQRLTSITFLMI